MSTDMSTTRWRGEPLVPENYGDIAALVALARQARQRVVEFEWMFADEELRNLRRAVYEWGRAVVGRYKCFDARMLSAINGALDEPNSAFVLNEPKNSRDLDCSISCVNNGERFRLHGQAPFDIVFGYGSAGTAENPWSAHLSNSVREVLLKSCGMLHWDLRLLQTRRYRPVRNALYGFPVGRLDVDEPEPPPSAEPVQEIAIHFEGPFSSLDNTGARCLFREPIASRSGVYLWTVAAGDVEHVWYVGQTRVSFGARTAQHLMSMLSGQYPPVDATALAVGEHRRAAPVIKGVWPDTLPTFLQNSETLLPNILAVIRMVKFHFAVLDGDAHRHNRVEGAIARYYKTHREGRLKSFLTPGLKVPAAIPFDRPLCLKVTSECPIAGFPVDITE